MSSATPIQPLIVPVDIPSLPDTYRGLENLHIVFWLLKDMAWCMVWRPLGIMMVPPTLGIAIAIAWRSRSDASELAHCLATVCWIFANSYWMASEFFGFDTWHPLPGITGKQLTLVPFLLGIVILAYYYLVQRPRQKRLLATAAA
jgi:hypothetical protein